MKRENLREAQTLINRITDFEKMTKWYEQYREREHSPYSVFVNLAKFVCRKKKHVELEVAFNNSADYSVGLSNEQQEELIELVTKWMKQDTEKLKEL